MEQSKFYQIKNITEHEYTLVCCDGSVITRPIQEVDKTVSAFTIQDAKDGDVLHSTGFHSDCVFIFKGLDNWKFDEPNGDRAVATGYCCLFVLADNMEFCIQGPDCIEVNTVKPAIKIQRNLLFQKMKEAGYEWDAEKKELKKIIQNPTWSEEDEKIVSEVIQNYESGFLPSVIERDRIAKTLKSLKDRVQPKQEWSVDDERTYRSVLYDFEHHFPLNCVQQEFVKSHIQPQNKWKPSDEQMRVLDLAIRCGINRGTTEETTLVSLFNDLKKLKE